MDEKEWIKHIVAGDTRLFSCLVAKYERMAYTIAFRILGNKEEAEEATQDAFVRMYRALPRFQFESKFSTWFYRIVYRVAISTARQRQPFDEAPIEAADAISPDEYDSALDLLQSKQRQAVVRRLLAQMRTDEPLCARIMGRVMAEKKRANNQMPAPRTLSPTTLIGLGFVYLIAVLGEWTWMTGGLMPANNWSATAPALLFSLIPVCGLAFFLLFNQLDEYLKSRRR